MSHPDEGVLQAYLDGELDSADLAELRAHLDACEACRAMLQEQQELMNEATTLVDRLVLDPPVRIPRPRARAWWKSPAVGIAASLAVALSTAVLLWKPASVSRDGQGIAPVEAREVAKDEAEAPAATPPALQPAPQQALAALPEKKKDTIRLRSGGVQEPTPARTEPAVAQRLDTASGAAFTIEGYEEALPADRAAKAANERSAADAAPGLRRIEGHEPITVKALGGARVSTWMVAGTSLILQQGAATSKRPERSSAAAAPAAPGAARVTAAPMQEYRWMLDGEEMVLRGALPVDSLAALARLVH